MVLLQTIWLMLPGIVADMTPALLSKVNFLNYPIDFNKKFNSKPILGKNKTFRGLIFGTLAAILTSHVQFKLTKYSFFLDLSILDYKNFLLIGLLLGSGALFGDLLGSFFKRQINIKPGQSWKPFDQIDSFLGAFVFISFFYTIPFLMVVVAFILSFILHSIIPYIGFLLKIRDTKS